MGFIEEMAKAKAFDDMQTKQVTDAMTAASKALQEQRAKEVGMNNVFQNVIRNSQGGLANIIGQGSNPRELEADLGRTIAPSTAEEGYIKRLNQIDNELGLGASMAGASDFGHGSPNPISGISLRNERENVNDSLKKLIQDRQL